MARQRAIVRRARLEPRRRAVRRRSAHRRSARHAALEENDFDPAADRFSSWTAGNFTTLDRNRDGRIVAREWNYDYESFRRVDRNNDGALTRAEFLGTNTVDDDRDDRFEYIDENGDGRIERREWHGSGETFAWLDRNRDDVLSRAEVVDAPAARAPRAGAPIVLLVPTSTATAASRRTSGNGRAAASTSVTATATAY